MSKAAFSIKIGGPDLKLEWFSGSGAGGQNRNKVQCCCRVKHLPSGVTVQATEQRSREQNKKVALERLSNHPIFKGWCLKQLQAREEGFQNLEAKVDEMMKPAQLKAEAVVEGKWQTIPI